MGKTSEPNRLTRQNKSRKFPPLSSTPNTLGVRNLTKEEKTELAEMHGQVLVDSTETKAA